MKNNDFIFIHKVIERNRKKRKNNNMKILSFIACFINCIILILNLIYFLKKILIYNGKNISFKNCDNLIINIIKKNYIDISNYLNKKYYTKIINSSITKTKNKKRLKLYSVDLFKKIIELDINYG